jgi:hypothetical protein
MGIVADQLEVLVLEGVDIVDLGVKAHLGQGAGLAGQLLAGLVEVICVEVQVAKSMDKIARAQAANLGDHEGKERVAGDIEGDAEKEIGAALVELATEFAIAHVKLEKSVAGGEGHLLDFADVPCADDEAAAIGVFADLGDYLVDLVDGTAIGGVPSAPLGAVYGAEVALGVRPFVPDGDSVLLKPANQRSS